MVFNLTCDCKSKSHCSLVRFWNHAYDFRPNRTRLSSITIIYKLHFCNLQSHVFAIITCAIYKSRFCDLYITFVIYKSHFCDLYIIFAIYKSHFCDLYITFAIYKSHFWHLYITFFYLWIALLWFIYHICDLKIALLRIFDLDITRLIIRTRVAIFKFQWWWNAVCKLHEISLSIYKLRFVVFCDL